MILYRLKTDLWSLMIIAFVVLSCNAQKKKNNTQANTIRASFRLIPETESGITFKNQLSENTDLNYFNYQYLYNGAGVAVGDINGDKLPDIFFTSNQKANQLYLNEGNLHFTNITTSAGVSGHPGWTSGCAMLDVNQDGLLDIYVCYSGNGPKAERTNELFINNGDNTFSESAASYGLDDAGYSTQIYPIDYDMDGDLDLYLVNHRTDFYNTGNVLNPDPNRDGSELNSDRLYRNDNNHFINITKQAGLINRSFGLSATIMDFNNDHWPDIYVANDFVEPDLLYLNNQNGTFSEAGKQIMKHISFYGMGSDYGDINNDGFEDMYVLDMAPPGHTRSKAVMASMDTKGFWNMVDFGFNYQYMLNTFQLNNGNGTFSEIAQMAGISKTDWSWAPLMFDADNDGMLDIFVSNGILKDVTDNDFKNWLQTEVSEKGHQLSFADVMAKIPSTKTANYLFINRGNLQFENTAQSSGLSKKENTNGAAWADLDLDGDLDLVMNNLDMIASVYENNASENGNDYLEISLKGNNQNNQAIGTEIQILDHDFIQLRHQYVSRGYQSSVDPIIHFGLGNKSIIDSLLITWPGGERKLLTHIAVNQRIDITMNQGDFFTDTEKSNPWVVQSNIPGLSFTHHENAYDDFAKELLLPHKESENGPLMSTGDVNADGLVDIFIGGAAGQAGALFTGRPDASFLEIKGPWQNDKACEDLGSLFFDADGDGDADLYVCSGSNEFDSSDTRFQDRLYLNNGKGSFSKAANALPLMLSSTMRVVASDWDDDGDLDLFVGARVTPGKYPFAPRSYLLQNDNGIFSDVTAQMAPALLRPGMVTDACFADFDNDGDEDLMIAGEWMPVRLFLNHQGHFSEALNNGLDSSNAWWFSLTAADIDNDGDMDLIAGNIGLNNKFQPSTQKPFSVYCNDFDHNGTFDIVLATVADNKNLWPVRGRGCSSSQMPFIKEKFKTYHSFATAYLSDIYSQQTLDSALHLQAYDFHSAIWMNDGKGHFTRKNLPVEAQTAPINAVVISDLNHDGFPDLIIAGNMWGAEVETTRYDAGTGLILLGDGQGGFKPLPVWKSGFYAGGNVKDMKILFNKTMKKKWILTGVNNSEIQVFVFD